MSTLSCLHAGTHRESNPRLEYGEYAISIQAACHNYCTPKKCLPSLEDYSEFEVALFNGEKWLLPEEIGCREKMNFEPRTLLNNTTVGGWISRSQVRKLLACLAAKSGVDHPIPSYLLEK